MRATTSKKIDTEHAMTANTAMLDNSELGDVKIHENVVASIVRKAALEIEGVSRLAGNALVDNIAEIVGSKRMQSRAITVDMQENNRLSIEVKLNILFGFKIPVVAQEVQKAVIEAVEAMTGMTVVKANVVVQEIDDPAPEPEATAEPELPMN